jgi:hypothetical protein
VATRIAVLDGSTVPAAWISGKEVQSRVDGDRASWVDGGRAIQMIPMVSDAAGSRLSLKVGRQVAAEFSCGRAWARSYVSEIRRK